VGIQFSDVVKASQTSSPGHDRQTMPSFDELKELPIVKTALDDLGERLPDNLHYHCLQHTLNVIEEVYGLAVKGNLNPNDVELLVVAAAEHDWGYLERTKNNEPIGAREAVLGMMKSGGYSLPDMIGVGRAILATALEKRDDGVMVQNPRTEFGRYLCDADLSGFGRERFFRDSLNVLNEIMGFPVTDPAELKNEQVSGFLKGTLRMVEAHHWHTPAAAEMYGEQKAKNVENLKGLVKAIDDSNDREIARLWGLMLPQS
jgi:uncharacterized protein